MLGNPCCRAVIKLRMIMVDNSLREKFADEKSRIIFDARMNYKRDKSLQSFYQFLKKNHEKYVFREVEEYIQKTGISRIFIWGNDDYSLYSYDVLKDSGYSVGGLITDSPVEVDNKYIYIHSDEIKILLENIIIIVFSRDVSSVPDEVMKRGNILSLYSHVVGRTGNQYFDYFSAFDKEYFVDAGSLDGTTSRKFVEWCGDNYGAVYAFEANPAMTKNCEEQLEQIVNRNALFFYKLALWDKKDTICFDNSGSKWDAHVSDNGILTVNADSIDNLLAGRRVTFMKFDIEGSEMKALQGARNCILNNRPRMAISVYHNDKDLEDIMEYLIGLNIDYNFALRHYHSDAIETILYVF